MNNHPMRRKDRSLSEEQALEIMQSAPFATISCLTPEGESYGVVVSQALDGKTLYFHGGMQGLKVNCFAAHPSVCISAVSFSEINGPQQTNDYRSAVIFGNVRIAEGEEAAHGMRTICLKFTPDYMPAVEACIAKSMGHTRVYAVDIERITGKGNV